MNIATERELTEKFTDVIDLAKENGLYICHGLLEVIEAAWGEGCTFQADKDVVSGEAYRKGLRTGCSMTALALSNPLNIPDGCCLCPHCEAPLIEDYCFEIENHVVICGACKNRHDQGGNE